MDAHFQPEDYKFIHQKARQDDSRQIEIKRKEALVKHAEDMIQQRSKASEKKKKKAAETTGRVAAIKLIFNKEEIAKLKGQALTDHIAAFQQHGAPNLDGITVRTVVGLKRKALCAAIDSYHAGGWKPTDVEDVLEEGNDMEGSEWEEESE